MRLFLLGATPSFDLSRHVTARDRLAATGQNTGNQLIAYGLLKALSYTHVEWDYAKGPAYVDENFDAIVIAAANFLFPGFDFGGMADFIAATKLPVLMVGLGAQAQSMDDPRIELSPGTRRLMQIVSERAHSIGVRGDFTAQVLQECGIGNVEIVGCPSYYANGEKGFVFRRHHVDPDFAIAVHASRDVIAHSFNHEAMRITVARLYSEMEQRSGIFIAQTEMEEIEIADDENRDDNLVRLLVILQNLGLSNVDRHKLLDAMRVYWDVDAWITAMADCKFVVGTRFHGTMVALLAGTPALCVTHDSRTSEMCKFLEIPSIDIVRFNEKSLDVLEKELDLDSLSLRYNYLLPRYYNFLRSNNMILT